eukprot:TRINITY_DN5414_c1_g1_i1.p1 TRINITY_DN5414_c1_g1~~TRINITY_DN5414_c1_g1_i1.p1  ORF type:complete len:806 (+),score=90.75 TRINITY_DN5414_c1_g1_i1:357-2420(+)
MVEEETPPRAAEYHVVTDKRAEDLRKCNEELELSESVWEAAFVAWTPVAGFYGSMFLSFLIVVNIILQVVFCNIAWTTFASVHESTFHMNVASDARKWRLSEAHTTERMEKSSWVSLASRVCDNDGTLVFGNMQAGILAELFQYRDPFLLFGIVEVGEQGLLLLGMCLVLWYLTVVQEILAAVDVVDVLCRIPHSGFRSRIVIDVENALAIEALGWPRRVSLLLMSCLRLLIALWLLFSGGVWLCLTSKIFDLILNAAALAFVLDCDELLYATMAPPLLKVSMKNLAPLTRRHGPMIRGLGIKGPIALLALFAYVGFLVHEYALPMKHRMGDVDIAMCHGHKAFVVEASGSLGHVVVAPTFPSTSGANDSILRRAVVEIESMTTDEIMRTRSIPVVWQNKSVMFVSSRSEFDKELRKTVADFMTPTCWDELHATSDNSVKKPYLQSLRFSTGRLDANHCSDFTDLCRSNSMIRSFCSFTCRCATIFNGLVDRSGCSAPCTSAMHVELSTFTGDDNESLSACFDKPQHIFLLPEVQELLKEYQALLDPTLPIENITKVGCGAFFPLSVPEIFSPESAFWLPDALCGRSMFSNIAIKNMPYQTLRWLCPVSCGCSLDFSSDCPRSCTKGSFAIQSDACASGICPGKVAAASVFLGVTCQQLDRALKERRLPQHHCAAIANQVAMVCCDD